MRSFLSRFKPVIVGQWQNLTTRHQVRGPFCHMCRKWIMEDEPHEGSKKHGWELVENTVGMPRSSVLVRVFHHNQEQVARIDLGEENWDDGMLERAVRRVEWFKPEEQVQP